MKHDFIYLDWNVVKALKEKSAEPIFSVMIGTLKTQFIIPFSFAHLCDRQKNMSESNIQYIKEDLMFFNSLSDGYTLGRYDDDYDIAKQDILKKYDEITTCKQEQYPSFNIPQEILQKIKSVGAKNFFKNQENIQLFPLIALSAFSRFNCNDEVYKEMREVFFSDPPEEVAYFRDLQKPEIKSEDLRKFVENMLKSEQPENHALRYKMGMAYLFLDFNQNYREKVSQKSNFTNMYTDSEHMLNASFAKYYITQDKKTRKKTKLVYQTYNIDTEVFSIEEFIEKFKM